MLANSQFVDNLLIQFVGTIPTPCLAFYTISFPTITPLAIHVTIPMGSIKAEIHSDSNPDLEFVSWYERVTFLPFFVQLS